MASDQLGAFVLALVVTATANFSQARVTAEPLFQPSSVVYKSCKGVGSSALGHISLGENVTVKFSTAGIALISADGKSEVMVGANNFCYRGRLKCDADVFVQTGLSSDPISNVSLKKICHDPTEADLPEALKKAPVKLELSITRTTTVNGSKQTIGTLFCGRANDPIFASLNLSDCNK